MSLIHQNETAVIKDEIENNGLDIKYCSVKDMWADVLTKPLQVSQFQMM